MTSMITIQDFCDYLTTCSNVTYKSQKNKKTINQIKKAIYLTNVKDLDNNESEFWLPSDIEDVFFQNLLGNIKPQTRLLRYISLSALNRLITSNTQSMLSVVSMNDRSEIDYTEEYFKRVHKGNSSYWQTIEEPLNTYILSCMENEHDELTMWRLYGDDTKGACLVYSIDPNLINNTEYNLAPLSYADKDHKHRELNLVYDMMTRGIKINKGIKIKFVFKRWNIWKHFFKPYDYHIENEVRLLYRHNKATKGKKWILSNLNIFTPLIEFSSYKNEDDKERLPLQIQKIILGPNFPESSLNKEILTRLMKENLSPIGVEQSTIDNYR